MLKTAQLLAASGAFGYIAASHCREAKEITINYADFTCEA